MSDRLLKVGQGNTPHHRDKRALLPPHRRPGAFLDFAYDHDFDLFGIAEMWPGITRAAADHPEFEARLPFPNNRRPMRLGNGAVWNEETIARKWWMSDIEVSISNGRGGSRIVHQPQMNFRVLGSRIVIPTIVCHAPRMKLDPAGNGAVQARVLHRAVKVAKRAGRCLVIGDMNEGDAWREFEAEGADTHHAGVGMIAAFGDIELRSKEVYRKGVIGEWSDHPLLGADVHGGGR